MVYASEDNTNSPAYHQEKAIQYAIEHQKEIHHQLLTHLLNEFPSIAENYDFLDIRGNKLPVVSNIEQFKRLIRLSVLYIKKEQKNGYAYVGYGFGCVWDGEHGLGIMTHKHRVIEIGGTDSAFAWVNDLNESI